MGNIKITTKDIETPLFNNELFSQKYMEQLKEVLCHSKFWKTIYDNCESIVEVTDYYNLVTQTTRMGVTFFDWWLELENPVEIAKFIESRPTNEMKLEHIDKIIKKNMTGKYPNPLPKNDEYKTFEGRWRAKRCANGNWVYGFLKEDKNGRQYILNENSFCEQANIITGYKYAELAFIVPETLERYPVDKEPEYINNEEE